MCIIAVKPQGVEAPSNDVLMNCFENNPDGAGVGVWRQGAKAMTVDKGYMLASKFFDKLDALSIGKNDFAIYHFRIGTSGGNVPANTHPFPIATQEDAMRALHYSAPYVMAHNGVLGKGDETRKLSDTQLYVLNTLAPRLPQDGKPYLREGIADEIAAETAGNRVVVFDAISAKYAMTGTWEQADGVYYSNTSYLPYRYKTVWDDMSYLFDDTSKMVRVVFGEYDVADWEDFSAGMVDMGAPLDAYGRVDIDYMPYEMGYKSMKMPEVCKTSPYEAGVYYINHVFADMDAWVGNHNK